MSWCALVSRICVWCHQGAWWSWPLQRTFSSDWPSQRPKTTRKHSACRLTPLSSTVICRSLSQIWNICLCRLLSSSFSACLRSTSLSQPFLGDDRPILKISSCREGKVPVLGYATIWICYWARHFQYRRGGTRFREKSRIYQKLQEDCSW